MNTGFSAYAPKVEDPAFTQWAFIGRETELDVLMKALALARAGKPQFVVIRPTPEQEADDENEVSKLSTGRGIGKTRLLYEFKNEVESRLSINLRTLAFLDLRRELPAPEDSFHELAVLRFFQRHGRLTAHDSWTQFKCMVGRALLILRLVGIALAAIIVFVAAVVQAAGGVQQQTNFVTDLYLLASRNLPVIIGVAVTFLLLTFWDAWSNPLDALRARWRSYISVSGRRNETIASDDPVAIAKLICSHFERDKTYVWLIDDVDHIGEISYDFISALYDSMVSQKFNFMFVVTYDPSNPILGLDSERIAVDLEDTEVRSKRIIDLKPLTHQDLSDIVSKRYGRDAAKARMLLSKIFAERDSEFIADESVQAEISYRSDVILGLFTFLEAKKKIRQFTPSTHQVQRSRWDFDIIDVQEVLAEFYSQDKITVEKLLHSIEQAPTHLSKECKDVVKYLLAFRNRNVDRSDLSQLMQIGNRDLTVCLEYLVAARILKREGRLFSFLNPDHKTLLLATVWKRWNADYNYTSKVFALLASRNNLNEQRYLAEQALTSRPSRAAVDILFKKASYLFNELGYANSARRYIADRDGALGKWRSLFIHDEHPESTVQKLLVWGSGSVTNFNPGGSWTEGKANALVRAVTLPEFGGRLLFMNGKLDSAEQVWQDGLLFLENLSVQRSYLDIPQTIGNDTVELRLRLSDLYFLRGDWNKADKLCDELLDKHPGEKTAMVHSRARFLKAVMTLYKKHGYATVSVFSKEELITLEELMAITQEMWDALVMAQESTLPWAESLCLHGFLWFTDQMTKHSTSKPIGMDMLSTWLIPLRDAIVDLRRTRLTRPDDADVMRLQGSFYLFGASATLSLLRFTHSVVMQHAATKATTPTLEPGPEFHAKETLTAEDTVRAAGEYRIDHDESEAKALRRIWQATDVFSSIWSAEVIVSDNELAELLKRLQTQGDLVKSTYDSELHKGARVLDEFLSDQARAVISTLLATLAAIGNRMLDIATDYLKRCSTWYSIEHNLFGLAEANYALSKVNELWLLMPQAKENAEDYRIKATQFRERSLDLRLRSGIAFRCPDLHMELARYKQAHGQHQESTQHQEGFTFFGEMLGFPAAQMALIHCRVSTFFFNTASVAGNEQRSRTHAEKAIELYSHALSDERPRNRETVERLIVGLILCKLMLAEYEYRHGQLESAAEHCQDILANFREIKKLRKPLLRAETLELQADISRKINNNYEAALAAWEDAYQVYHAEGELFYEIQILGKIVSTVRAFSTDKFGLYLRKLKVKYEQARKRGTSASEHASAMMLAQAADTLAHWEPLSQGIYRYVPTSGSFRVNDARVRYVRQVSQLKYLEEAFEAYSDVGEYRPAWKVLTKIVDMWLKNDTVQDSDNLQKFRTWVAKMLTIVDIDEDDPASMEVLRGVVVYQSALGALPGNFNFRLEQKIASIERARKLLQIDNLSAAVAVLREAWTHLKQKIAKAEAAGEEYEPDSLDIEIVDEFYSALEASEEYDLAHAILSEKKRLRGVFVGSSLYRLGEYYEPIRPEIALRLYTLGSAQDPKNYFSLLCRQKRDALHYVLQEQLSAASST